MSTTGHTRRQMVGALGLLAARSAFGSIIVDLDLDLPDYGRFERHANFDSRHVAPRDVVVWLPPGYDAGGEHHDVLYMHDGRNLFDPASGMGHGPWGVDVRLSMLLATREVRPTIVVGIDNTPSRWREYAPAPAVAALSPRLRSLVEAHGGGASLSDDYVAFLVEELKPWVDARYRTRPERTATTLMGSSMGGLISLYTLCRYPDVYGAAGCLSTHWPLTTSPTVLGGGPGPDLAACGAPFIDWLDTHLPPAGRHRLYFDHGTVWLDGLYAPFQARVDALLGARGYRRGVDWESRVFEGDEHNEAAWRTRLATPLKFLLGR
jgi:enterochelin esterase-like enzyme